MFVAFLSPISLFVCPGPEYRYLHRNQTWLRCVPYCTWTWTTIETFPRYSTFCFSLVAETEHSLVGVAAPAAHATTPVQFLDTVIRLLLLSSTFHWQQPRRGVSSSHMFLSQSCLASILYDTFWYSFVARVNIMSRVS
jgi:hypothetical protein